MGGPTRYKSEDKMSPLDVGQSLTLSFLMIIYLGTTSTDEKKTNKFCYPLLSYSKPQIGINLDSSNFPYPQFLGQLLPFSNINISSDFKCVWAC